MSEVLSCFSFFVGELPMTRNVADRKNWRALANEKKRWAILIRAAAGQVKAAEPCDLIITFRSVKADENDTDNLYARAKSPLDALKRCGIISNDNRKTIRLRVKPEKVAHRNEQGTLIEWREILPFDDVQERVGNEGYE